MDTDDLARAEAVALDLAAWACAALTARRPRSGATVAARVTEQPTDPDGALDVRIERHVRAVLAEAFPAWPVRGRARDRDGAPEAGPRWLVDPVGGTTNHGHGLAWSAFSLALAVDGETQVGVVADPWRGELFSAVRGEGARCNGDGVHASSTTELAGQVVLAEGDALRPGPGTDLALAELAARRCSVRIMGSVALSVAQVAAGRAAGTAVGTAAPQDTAAATLVAAEAGAVVRAVVPGDGGRGDRPRLLVAAPRVAADLQAVFGMAGAAR